jgi:hypothetical protein
MEGNVYKNAFHNVVMLAHFYEINYYRNVCLPK